MRTYLFSLTATLAAALASLAAGSDLHAAHSPWSDAGFNYTSHEGQCWYAPAQPDCPPSPPSIWSDIGLSVFGGVENFRGIPDADAGDNNGAKIGFELAAPLPYLKQYGIGFQVGASCGAFDFAGRAMTHHQHAIQTQSFLTMGLFVRPEPRMPLSLGIVYDWMFNHRYGVFAESPTLGQVRGQMAYFVGSRDEVGVFGTYDVQKSHQTKKHLAFDFRVTYRPIAQANLFWRHLFGGGVESTIWAGTPLRNRLNRTKSNRPGKYIIGAEIAVPFLESWALIGRACYMQPSTKNGPVASREYASNIAINLVYYFGGDPNRASGESSAWMPYMPMANNSNFFVDAASKIVHYRSLGL